MTHYANKREFASVRVWTALSICSTQQTMKIKCKHNYGVIILTFYFLLLKVLKGHDNFKGGTLRDRIENAFG